MKKKDFAQFIFLILKILLIFAVVAAFTWVWYTYVSHAKTILYYRRGHWFVIFLYGVIYYAITEVYSAFRAGYFSLPELIFNQILALTLSNLIIYIFTCFVTLSPSVPLAFFEMYLVQILCAVIWAWCANKFYFWTNPCIDTLIVYQNKKAQVLFKKLGNYPRNYSFKEKVCISEGFDVITAKMDDYPAVILCYLPSYIRDQILKQGILKKKSVYLTPNVGDIIISGAKRVHLLDTPILLCEASNQSLYYRFVKRALDLMVSLLMLIVTSPIMVITAIAIKAHDHGPVFYKQTRLTLGGACFEVYKFRSMVVDAEKDGVARLSSKHDNRITPVGRFIRATRIDELPQLFNVLSGKMTLVGPRPERPEIAKQYCEKWPEFQLRLQMKAGLTGYAQIFGKYNTTPKDKLRLDLMYIADSSIIQDFRILFLTIKVVFMKESTEGIDDGATTAGE